jgi:hypothetical protein
LWSLAAVIAVMIYRNGQLADHRCLAALPKPTENVTIGVVAVAIVAMVGALLVVRAPTGHRRRAVWPLVVYAVVATPLLVGAVALTVSSPAPGPPKPYACMDDLEELP